LKSLNLPPFGFFGKAETPPRRAQGPICEPKCAGARKQKLALLDAATAIELRAIIRKLLDDDGKRQHVVEEQWSRLGAAGYDRDYFAAVRSALRQLVGVVGA